MSSITISFPDDKLDAIRQFSEETDSAIETELTHTAEKVYRKRVPAAVRKFIENRTESAKPRTKKPKQSIPTE